MTQAELLKLLPELIPFKTKKGPIVYINRNLIGSVQPKEGDSDTFTVVLKPGTIYIGKFITAEESLATYSESKKEDGSANE